MVHVANRRATARVANRRRGEQRGTDEIRAWVARRREEARNSRGLDRSHTTAENSRTPLFEQVRIPDARRGVRKHQPLDPRARMQAEPLPDHAAQRQAAVTETLARY